MEGDKRELSFLVSLYNESGQEDFHITYLEELLKPEQLLKQLLKQLL